MEIREQKTSNDSLFEERLSKLGRSTLIYKLYADKTSKNCPLEAGIAKMIKSMRSFPLNLVPLTTSSICELTLDKYLEKVKKQLQKMKLVYNEQEAEEFVSYLCDRKKSSSLPGYGDYACFAKRRTIEGKEILRIEINNPLNNCGF